MARSVDYLHQIGSRGGFPTVERLPTLGDDRSLDSADADDVVELDEDLGHPLATGLVDLRVDASLTPIGPALAVEESRGPREVLALQPRELDRNVRACLSSKRAETSSKRARAVAQMCAASLR